MLDILDILNQATKPDLMDKEMCRASKQLQPYWDKVQKAFSRQFVDEMSQADDDLWELECREHFARGLWLGLRLGQFTEQGPSGGVGNF